MARCDNLRRPPVTPRLSVVLPGDHDSVLSPSSPFLLDESNPPLATPPSLLQTPRAISLGVRVPDFEEQADSLEAAWADCLASDDDEIDSSQAKRNADAPSPFMRALTDTLSRKSRRSSSLGNSDWAKHDASLTPKSALAGGPKAWLVSPRQRPVDGSPQVGPAHTAGSRLPHASEARGGQRGSDSRAGAARFVRSKSVAEPRVTGNAWQAERQVRQERQQRQRRSSQRSNSWMDVREASKGPQAGADPFDFGSHQIGTLCSNEQRRSSGAATRADAPGLQEAPAMRSPVPVRPWVPSPHNNPSTAASPRSNLPRRTRQHTRTTSDSLADWHAFTAMQSELQRCDEQSFFVPLSENSPVPLTPPSEYLDHSWHGSSHVMLGMRRNSAGREHPYGSTLPAIADDAWEPEAELHRRVSEPGSGRVQRSHTVAEANQPSENSQAADGCDCPAGRTP